MDRATSAPKAPAELGNAPFEAPALNDTEPPPEPSRPIGQDTFVSLPRVSGEGGPAGPLCVGIGTTVIAALLSYALPEAHAATGVGLCFLAVVYAVVLYRGDARTIRAYGLGLGGLFEPVPIDARRVSREFLSALGWALALAALVFPVFWLGYVFWYRPSGPFQPAPVWSSIEDLPGQLLGIAFPEEAFYRGYLQSALDRALPPSRRVLGTRLGWGILLSSALFAFGHFLTDPVPARLAVFFPSLAFGWLRSRSGGIGAPLAFHAFCNLFASYLGRSYGLFR